MEKKRRVRKGNSVLILVSHDVLRSKEEELRQICTEYFEGVFGNEEFEYKKMFDVSRCQILRFRHVDSTNNVHVAISSIENRVEDKRVYTSNTFADVVFHQSSVMHLTKDAIEFFAKIKSAMQIVDEF